jgi:hypothetical protein
MYVRGTTQTRGWSVRRPGRAIAIDDEVRLSELSAGPGADVCGVPVAGESHQPRDGECDRVLRGAGVGETANRFQPATGAHQCPALRPRSAGVGSFRTMMSRSPSRAMTSTAAPNRPRFTRKSHRRRGARELEALEPRGGVTQARRRCLDT